MLEQVCAYIHNYFIHGQEKGTFTIEDGALDLPSLMPGQYFRIMGSRFNDGVHQYPATDLADETFDGFVLEMRVPRAVLNLVDEIEAWQAKYGAAAASPYQSESFAGYSYSKASVAGSKDGVTTPTWQSTFAARLNEWRKLA